MAGNLGDKLREERIRSVHRQCCEMAQTFPSVNLLAISSDDPHCFDGLCSHHPFLLREYGCFSGAVGLKTAFQLFSDIPKSVTRWGGVFPENLSLTIDEVWLSPPFAIERNERPMIARYFADASELDEWGGQSKNENTSQEDEIAEKSHRLFRSIERLEVHLQPIVSPQLVPRVWPELWKEWCADEFLLFHDFRGELVHQLLLNCESWIAPLKEPPVQRHWLSENLFLAIAILIEEVLIEPEELSRERATARIAPDTVIHPIKRIQEALDYIIANGPVKSISVARALGIGDGTFRRHYVPELKKCGVRNDRRMGGYFVESSDGAGDNVAPPSAT